MCIHICIVYVYICTRALTTLQVVHMNVYECECIHMYTYTLIRMYVCVYLYIHLFIHTSCLRGVLLPFRLRIWALATLQVIHMGMYIHVCVYIFIHIYVRL